MPIRTFRCDLCGISFKTKQEHPLHCQVEAIAILEAPKTKFMEKVDPDKGKSQLVNQQSILKERARAHSRDVDMIDLIEKNPMEDAKKNGWVREDGKVRKKIDDL